MTTGILSFISPCGRLGRLGFWSSQLVVAVALMVGRILFQTGDMVLCGRPLITPHRVMDLILALDISCLPNLIGLAAGDEMAKELAGYLLYAPIPSETIMSAMTVSGAALCLLGTWSCLCLIIQRLRDIRHGWWYAPLCVPFLWGLILGKEIIRELPFSLSLLYFFLMLAGNIVYCLPSRAIPPR